eukprot:COSAG02_NODE_56728_length_284_cov_0.702703_1_plen_59_part_10
MHLLRLVGSLRTTFSSADIDDSASAHDWPLYVPWARTLVNATASRRMERIVSCVSVHAR